MTDTRPRPGDAGRDEAIARRLEKNPHSRDAKLDEALDESMDASDPPAVTMPGRSRTVPPPSSGYDAEEEHRRAG